jgi:hypothetical protein
MSGGQQINSGQGAVAVEGAEETIGTMVGSFSTASPGSFVSSVSARLRSRKIQESSSSKPLVGSAFSGVQGALGRQRTKVLSGSSSTASRGTLTASTTPPPPQALLVDEVSIDTELRNHEDVLWYPDLTSWNTIKTDFSWPHNSMQLYGNAPTTWPKLFFTTVPEYGNIPAMRFESGDVNTTSWGAGFGDGLGIASFWKWFDENRRDLETLTGSSLWTGGYTDPLYMRYSVMLEEDYWPNLNELGVKLPGLATVAHNQNLGWVGNGNYCHLWMHYSWPGQHYAANGTGDGPIREPRLTAPGYDGPCIYPDHLVAFQSYFAGEDLWRGNSESKNWLPQYDEPGGVVVHPGVWHTVEQRWKMNTGTPGQPANFDGEVDIWIDDELKFSMRNARFRYQFDAVQYDPPGAIDRFRGIIYHGGQGRKPLGPLHFSITGICLANRPIGKTKEV